MKGLAQGHTFCTIWCDEPGLDPGWPIAEALAFTAQPASLACPPGVSHCGSAGGPHRPTPLSCCLHISTVFTVCQALR